MHRIAKVIRSNAFEGLISHVKSIDKVAAIVFELEVDLQAHLDLPADTADVYW